MHHEEEDSHVFPWIQKMNPNVDLSGIFQTLGAEHEELLPALEHYDTVINS
jgi:hypothetical protein